MPFLPAKDFSTRKAALLLAELCALEFKKNSLFRAELLTRIDLEKYSDKKRNLFRGELKHLLLDQALLDKFCVSYGATIPGFVFDQLVAELRKLYPQYKINAASVKATLRKEGYCKKQNKRKKI